MVVVNEGGDIVMLNARAQKEFGYGRDELVGQKVTSIIPEGFAERLLADALRSSADALAQQIGSGIELVGRRKSGSEFPIEIMLSPLKSTEGILVTAAIRDITVRKAAEQTIRRLSRVYAMLGGINALSAHVHDRDVFFRGACRIAVEAGAFQMAWIAMVDREAMKIVPVASAGVDETLLTAIKDRFLLAGDGGLGDSLAAQAISGKRTVVANDLSGDRSLVLGKQYSAAGIESIAVFPLIVSDEAVGVLALYAQESEFFRAEELELLTGLTRDVSVTVDHIVKQERLDYIASYDVLTGLANHRLFLDRVAQYMRSASSRGHKLALFLVDLERFKNINDSLGESAGDELLRQVAIWLTHSAGDANMVARVSADHFAVVLPAVKHEDDMARLLEKTLHDLRAHPFRLNDTVFRIAAKVGVALFPTDGSDADTVFKNAEAALKKAKEDGDPYLFYTQNINARVAEKLTLENRLRDALDKGEFVLHYQPKVNIASGKLTGAEALIRWNDPHTGLVPPVDFIPVLEEIGLIHEVGRWALRQAITDYLRWRNAGLAVVRIAVNVSPLQLRQRDFSDEISRVVEIDEHAAAGLELEITESLLMENVERSISALKLIRAMGITIAVDDFGTGYSSLNYLSKLPLDSLKIDRSFVIEMTAAPEGLALVSTIINLAHSLKLKVVAEGVETLEQSRLLQAMDCDEMQGYLLSKAVPAEILEQKFLGRLPDRA
ncbi:MAG: EAL domain-containing protein [Burkholderiales bacterium]|nr:EAL domain-containing protein [Burkholderiales bacterium]MDP2398142.1 EAL domain-containing protein [Burkholderiales bacterium]